MTAQTVVSRHTRALPVRHVMQFETVAALTTGTAKGTRLVPFYARILDVIARSGTAGSGGTSDIIDVNLNGTTIFTTQGNRPTLLQGDTGWWSVSGLGATSPVPDVVMLAPGDIISYDVDQQATTGSALFTLTILLGDA